MPNSAYPNGFNDGVSIRQIPILITQNPKAKVFHVNNGANGSDNHPGTEKHPLATIDAAVDRCTANQGDIIYVAPGHIESVIAASGITFDVAGVTVIFMGEGSNKATIDFGTDVGASIVLSAANVKLVTPRFTASIDALTGPISITAANCGVVNYEYYDGVSIDTTDCFVLSGAADYAEISGEYIPGDEGGTQKQSHIQFSAATEHVFLGPLKIRGDFATYPIEMTVGAMTDLHLKDIFIKNTNVGPIAAMGIHASSTGWADHVKLRIVSGTTYVSSLALLNWDNDSVGFNTDGGHGDPLGSTTPTTIEGKVDLIQADLGNPSARANFQDIEDMIGIPDAANSNVDDILRTGFNSSAITRNVDGSVLERLEDIKEDLSGSAGIATFPAAAAPTDGVSMAAVLRAVYNLSLAGVSLTFTGTCDAGMIASTTSLVSAELIGYGDDFFNTKYYIQVIKNANAVGTAPETEVRQISDYVSATGTFTTVAFSVNVEASDELLVLHESLVVLGRDDADNTIATTNVVANADGSLLERDQFNQEAIAVIDAFHDVPVADVATNAQMRDVIGNKTDAGAAGAVGATESLMAYAKQTVTEGIARDAAIAVIDAFHDVPVADVADNAVMSDVIGNKTDAGAAGAVSATESLMAYAKQLVTEGIARDAALAVVDAFHDVPVADVADNAQMSDVIGNKTDAAAAGAVSAVESIMAYAKQLVTEGIARDAVLTTIDGLHDVPVADVGTNAQMRDVIGNKTDAAAAGAVSATESLMAYAKQLVTEGIARDAAIAVVDAFHDVPVADVADNAQMSDVVGNKTDAAAAGAVSTTESLMAYAKQNVTNTNYIANTAIPPPTANSLASYIAAGSGAVGTTLGAGVSIIDALGSNGSTLAYGSGSILGAIGTVHVITKTLVSSTIPQDGVSTVNITGVSSGGPLIIEEVTLNTNGTGLAGGTNFQLEISGNIYGSTGAIMAETVANLGANKTISGTNASITPLNGAVLENGAKIVATSTVGACTGAGVIQMQIKFRRVAAGATVAVA